MTPADRPDPSPPARGIHGAELPTAGMQLDRVEGPLVTLRCADGGSARATLTVADDDLVRIEVMPTGRAAQTRSWAIVDADGDVPLQGRERDDLGRFRCPPFALNEAPEKLVVRTGALTIRIGLAPLRFELARPDGRLLWRDLAAGAHGHRPGAEVDWHWERDDTQVLYGLGEASGALDRSRRRLRLRPLDALAYDAASGDPLYKHLPVLIMLTPDAGAFGLLLDTAAEAVFDLGAEVDNYHGPYRHLSVGEESLDAWFLAGPTLPAVHARIHYLGGRPSVPPRWTLGYLASTMRYTDADDPAAAFDGFVSELARHQLPCSAMHLSSGYSLADDGRRYVFEWNRRRVPDPAAMIEPLRQAGLRTVANIKPALLTSHPDFAELARLGLLVRNAGDDLPYLSRFWDGDGGYLDFSSADAYAWWIGRVRERILANGIDATWNDNNEFQIWDDQARTHAGPAGGLRPVLTQLMNRASRDAQRAHHGDGARDWSLTRSGMLGSWRYAQTWTGDNHTDWKTLRFNVPMGLNLSLSGWSSFGHDVGGFAGPLPDAELLVRWTEHGVGMPRFTIHSWNDDGSATEPWSHPQVVPQIRALLAWRERLVPYLATLARKAATEAEPLVRPLAWDFPDWRPGWREDLTHMLGRAILVAPVVEPGATIRPVRLPPGRWLELTTGLVHDGDQQIPAAAPLGTPCWFLREGCSVPVVGAWHLGAEAQVGVSELVRGGVSWGEGGGVAWLTLPAADGSATGELLWDDGLTRAHERGEVDRLGLDVSADQAVVLGRVASTMGVPRSEVLLPDGPGADPRTPLWGVRWRAHSRLVNRAVETRSAG